MSNEITFNMIVDSVYFVGKREVVAAGMIESGVIHLGDVVEIHYQDTAGSATVTRIEISKKEVEQAGPGDYVRLAFVDPDRNAIERGAMIVRHAGAESAEKVQPDGARSAEKIQPDAVQHSDSSSRPRPQSDLQYYKEFGKFVKRKPPKHLALKTLLSVIGLFVGYFFISIGRSTTPNLHDFVITNLYDFIPLLILGAGLGLVIYCGLIIIPPFYYKWVLSRGSASATATISHFWRKEYKNTDSNVRPFYTYHIAFEFNPSEASASAGPLGLQGEVAKKYWDKHNGERTVTVRYSTRNPKIVLLEGE